jgi:L-2-hydroxyglutarate oxidase
MRYDFCIIGAGIVGLATAMELLKLRPGASLILLEKEDSVARHQTGHNSGVIHAGIYYAPGSLKADLCRRGSRATQEFCDANAIPYEICGKLLVATSPLELQRMEQLVERAAQNQIAVDRLSADDIKQMEPHIAGLGGLLVHASGIVDYRRVCQAMADIVQRSGGALAFGVKVDTIRETGDEVLVRAGATEWRAGRLIACAGLQSDRLAVLAGIRTDHQIIPFRGEYYRLPKGKSDIIRHLIYPIPDPDLPFLGVHLTRMIDGSVTLGPNAVLGFAREGYTKFSMNLPDMAEYLRFGGFWKTTFQNLASGVSEFRNSLFKSGYLKLCQKYCPELAIDDLLPMQAGIRAQAVMRDGTLVHDFLFLETDRMLHVCNAPSPAATSAIPIGEMIARKVLPRAAAGHA